MKLRNPEWHATNARNWTKRGEPERAFTEARKSIMARAVWVLVNGKWVPRPGVMRDA